MKIQSQKDFVSGLAFTTIGIVFALGSRNYPLGSGARMGPGYFPLLLGVLLAILGAAITVKALLVKTKSGDKIGDISWKPLIFIILANLVFGALLGGLPAIGLPPMGLIASIYALTMIACLAGDEYRFKESLILATVLALGSHVIFNVMLQLQFPLWPTFTVG